jgi:pimeloyl-ACP methyl ester carboxylesterase
LVVKNKEIWRGLRGYLTGNGYDVWMADIADGGTWSFDELVKQGIPAMLAQIPGRPHWVGYDAGGLAILAFLSSNPGKSPLGRGICIACPIKPEIPSKAMKEALDAMRSNPKSPALSESLVTLLLANDGLEESQLKWFLSEGKSEAMLRDAVQWYEKGCWCSSDGSRNYADGLSSVSSPVLFMSGQIDTVVPPWLCLPGVSAISSREKLFYVLEE